MEDNNETELNVMDRNLVPSALAWHYKVVPYRKNKLEFELFACHDDVNDLFRTELEAILGSKVKLLGRSREEIEQALLMHYRKDPVKETSNQSVFTIESKDFVFELLQEAKALKSSDIHIETYDQYARIRFRIDGKLIERMQLKKVEYPALVNKIKIIAGLDISEKRLPQDGRIFYNRDNIKFDIRVSVLPSLYGEKIVLRILGGSSMEVNLDTLGFRQLDLLRFKESIKKPSGIILISGPTGSGKTTTLYATLKQLNKESQNILTIEDPIEYTLEGINQVQVKEEIGLTFSSALRSFLRQDPDIIMVGEIRDKETADLAIRAALTGHLVLSTIHTNSAWGTIDRLIDMEVPPFLIANTLVVSLAQRLVRLLCPLCKQRTLLDTSILPSGFKIREEHTHHYVPIGCKQCYYTGYQGRKAIYELIAVDTVISDFIINRNNYQPEYFKLKEVKTLQDSALEILQCGETSIEEIYSYLLDDQY